MEVQALPGLERSRFARLDHVSIYRRLLVSSFPPPMHYAL